MFILLAAVMALTAPQEAPTVQAVPYDEAVRCAGLTQGASELEGSETGRGKTLFDAALYWSLTAMQMSQFAGKPENQAEADQTRARLRAVRELSANDGAARAALDACLQRTPNLG